MKRGCRRMMGGLLLRSSGGGLGSLCAGDVVEDWVLGWVGEWMLSCSLGGSWLEHLIVIYEELKRVFQLLVLLWNSIY